LVEAIEEESGGIVLSYRKAKRYDCPGDEAERQRLKEGAIVSGIVTRRIRGGLLVNVGVNVFLPARELAGHLADDIGKTIECEIVEIDEPRRHIVVHFRNLVERPPRSAREEQEIDLGIKQVWDKLAERYPPGTVITGTVRLLTYYGAFIAIEEGIDGLLHVSDLSRVRKVHHPIEVLNEGDRVTCVIVDVDPDRRRIALGLRADVQDNKDAAAHPDVVSDVPAHRVSQVQAAP
jgi:small subunit ribosomal protein S1